MHKIITFSFQWLDQITDKINFLVIFLLSVADRVTLMFIPAEVIVPFSGFLVAQGRFSFWSVLVVVTIGNLVGEVILFWFSVKGGRWLLEKYGKYFFVSKHELGHVDSLFQKHGGKIVFWGRFIPVARMLIAVPAGIAKMRIDKFLLYTFLGMLPYNLAFLYLGFAVGDNHQLLIEVTNKYFSRFDWYAGIILVGLVIWYVWRHFKKKHATHE